MVQNSPKGDPYYRKTPLVHDLESAKAALAEGHDAELLLGRGLTLWRFALYVDKDVLRELLRARTRTAWLPDIQRPPLIDMLIHCPRRYVAHVLARLEPFVGAQIPLEWACPFLPPERCCIVAEYLRW